MDQRFRLAAAAGEHEQQALKEQENDQQQEDRDAEGPQPLGNPQGRSQHADVRCPEQDGFIDEIIGALGNEADEHRQCRKAQEMHRVAQPVGQVIDQHVDADMRARGESVRQRP